MDTIRALLVDPDEATRGRLQGVLAERPDLHLLGSAETGRHALARLSEGDVDLAVIDADLPDIAGFDLLRRLPPGRHPATVFLGSDDHHAVLAFEAHALGFLRRPFTDDRARAVLATAARLVRAVAADRRPASVLTTPPAPDPGYLTRVALKDGTRVALLNVDDIDWIAAAGMYVELHTGTSMHLHRASLASLLERLDPSQFVRVHRSVVVNTDRIKELRQRGHSDYTVLLRDGRAVPLSRAYRGQFERWLRQSL